MTTVTAPPQQGPALADVGDVAHFPHRNLFASWTGTKLRTQSVWPDGERALLVARGGQAPEAEPSE